MLLVASIILPVMAMTDSEWQTMRKAALERQRKIIIDNDGDDFSDSIPMNETVNPDKQMALRTSFMHKYPVDTIVYSVTYGSFDQVFVPNKYANTWSYAKPGQKNITQELLKMGTDPIKLQLEYCKKHNIEFWAGFRINDTHDAGDRPDKPWPGFPESKRKNPHLLIGSYEKQPPHATWSSWDFTHKEVRDKFANIVIDVARNYEVDAVYIDLYRWLGIFKSVGWGEEASDSEREMFSDMLRKIRREIEKIGRERKHPILFAIRVPDSVGYSRAVGFDWEKLMKEGIFDIVIAADNHHLQYWGKSAELCHKYGIKCYPSISMPCFVSLPRLYRHDRRSYFAREAAALAAGMDGLFFFNVFEEPMVKAVVPESFAALQTYDKRYHVSGMVHWRPSHNLATGENYNELPELSPVTPCSLPPEKSRNFKLEFGDDLVQLRAKGQPVHAVATLLADALPNSVEVKVNGVTLKHIASMGDTHSYEVSDSAFKPGLNTVTFCNKNKSNKKVPQVIMKGDALKTGNNQFPWRRIFAGNRNNNEVEKIVDNSYRIFDNGVGYSNLVYPLGSFDEYADFSFEMKSEDTNAAEAAMIRIAFAGKTEMITFGNNKIGLAYCGKSVPFDTTSFKKYSVKADKNKITVYCDNKAIISGKMCSLSNAETRLNGVIISVPYASNRSLIVGSLSDNGKGASYWRNLTINRPAGDANIKDFAVDVRLSPPPQPKMAEPWDFVSKPGETQICAGIYAYHSYDYSAELELDNRKGTSDIYVSNGGLMCSFKVKDNGIEFNDAAPIALPASEKITIRVEIDEFAKASVFVGDTFVEMPTQNVSMQLRDKAEIRKLNEATGNIIRNSGIVVINSNKDAVKSIKVRMFAPEDKAKEAKAKLTYVEPSIPTDLTPIVAYNAVNGMIDTSVFKHNYPQANLELLNNKLRINNGADNKTIYSMISMLNSENILNSNTPLLVKAKLTLTQANGADGNIFHINLNAGEAINSNSIFFAPGRIILAGYGSFRNNAIQVGKPLDIAWFTNPVTGKNILWVNGKLIGEKELKSEAKNYGFTFGDGSGTVAGAVELESIELYKVKSK